MKKFFNYLTMSVALLTIFSGCSKNEIPEPIKKEIKIALTAEGNSVLMAGEDTSRSFTVTSDESVTEDLAITIATDAVATDATLEAKTITILKGTKIATGKITFLGSAFPIGGTAKNIKITISAPNVEITGDANAVYAVTCSAKPLEKSTATLICETTEVFISGSEVRVPVKVVLDKAAQQYVDFRLVYGAKNTIEKGSWTSVSPISIEEGSSEVTFDIVFAAENFPAGFSGVSNLKLTSEGAIIGTPSEIILNVKGVEPTSAILSTDGTDVVVGDTDTEKTITVTLSGEARADVQFDVAVEGKEGDFEIVDNTITVKKGETTGTGVIKFLQKAFPIELMTGTAKVSITTTAGDITLGEPNKLLFNIKGMGTAPMGTISTELTTIKVGAEDKVVEFSVKVSEVLTKDAVFAITATSDKNDSFTLDTESVTISAGALEAKGTITFKTASFPYDTDKVNVKVVIASEDVIVINSASTLDLKVSGETINPDKEDMKYIFETTSGTIYVGDVKTEASLFFVAEGREPKATKEHNIYPEITGAVEGIDYEWVSELPVKIEAGNNYSYIKFNILPAGADKTFNVELFCDEATIGSSNVYTLTTEYVVWPPVTRQAPRIKIGTANDNYGFCVPKMGFGDDLYEFTFSRDAWLDLSETKTFTLTSKEAVLNLNAFTIDKYYQERMVLYMFADYNADGKFDGENEKIVSKKLEGIGIGAENVKDYANNFTVPEGVNEFIVRICVIYTSKEDFSVDFKDGYFVNPGNTSMAHMADFKVVVSE
ncbi:MAG: hypothetical protein IMY73_04130 [Bacteroidetes bacterium]|nr:hypothetical protein [Bacteroidota bacterium]